MKQRGVHRRCAAVAALTLIGVNAAQADRLTQNWQEGLKVIQETKFTPAKAVAAAESLTKGKALSVRNVSLRGTFSIWVHTYAGDKCKVVPVDPKTGKTGPIKEGSAADLSCATGADAIRIMEESKTSVTQAIQTAEAHSKGTVLSAKTEVKDGVLTFVMTSAVEGKLMLVTVDGKTGMVTSMEADKPAPAKGG